MSYELTDAQVLTQLRLRKIKLTLELERVDIAIKAFEEVDVSGMNKFDLMAIDTDVDTDLAADKRYSPTMTNEQKVLWALSKMKRATAVEISDYLIHTDPELKNRHRVITAITYTASRMFNAGKIGGEKVGTKNWYKLKANKI
ncbi:hypothetical protein [Mucilaginibacter ginsenosidivorans]|uniref:Uncharacterized protein n=1 Tax=Mucilaginibacter ginsenosidivorans TaxID=398053 RepID=A0A5B8V1C4_9SPHI|nr:hypothetical protein [Mucilaginibacter ginsenosidivorans]QEC65164.1 hypothetical protein FRZ54_22190 [Mucilaginibacter ginsenosidivorans]